MPAVRINAAGEKFGSLDSGKHFQSHFRQPQRTPAHYGIPLALALHSASGIIYPSGPSPEFCQGGGRTYKNCVQNFSQGRAHLRSRNFNKKLLYVSTFFQCFPHIWIQKIEILVPFNFIITIIDRLRCG